MNFARWIFSIIQVSLISTLLAGCSDFQAEKGTGRQTSMSNSISNLFRIASINAVTCPSVSQKVNTGAEGSADLQACVDATPEGGTLALPPGILMVSTTVKVNRRILVKTENRGDDIPCELDDQSCFQIRATAQALPENALGLLALSGTGGAVVNIIVDGNRTQRVGSVVHTTCVGAINNGLGFTMSALGNGLRVQGVVAKNAVCGTGFYVMGDDLHINDNLIAYNGVHDQPNLWSDGMTVGDTSNSEFIGNTFIDNTDVDFIFGGARGTRIQLNSVIHSDSFAGSSFAAIMMHSWPGGATSGDYTGADVHSNSVDCGLRRRCGIGLYLGAESWYSSPLFGGYFHDNVIRNALNGFMVERASGLIRIKDNVVTNSGGLSLTSTGLRETYEYNIPDFSNVQIEDTLISRGSYHSESFARSIPNFWNAEQPWESGQSLALRNSGAPVYQNVSIIYRRLLKREPDTAGHQAWVNYLASGATTSMLEAGFKQSPEYRSNLIRKVYRSYLGREVEEIGLQSWAAFLSEGHGQGEFISRLLDSPEYHYHTGH